jgi:hypothetical protein
MPEDGLSSKTLGSGLQPCRNRPPVTPGVGVILSLAIDPATILAAIQPANNLLFVAT